MNSIIPTELDKAYLAGCFDCDGSITLGTNSSGYFRPRLEICGVSEPMHQYIQERFGGTPSQHSKHTHVKNTIWQAKDEVKFVLKAIQPYLIHKKHQAVLIIEVCEMPRAEAQGTRTADIYAEMKTIHQKNHPQRSFV